MRQERDIAQQPRPFNVRISHNVAPL
jgi:hypothetical protein